MDDIHEYFKYSMIRNERYMVSLDQPLFFNKTNERCKNVVIDGRAIMQTMLFKVGSVLELIASDSKYGDRYFEAECNFDKYSIPVESVEDIENMKKCTNDSVTIGYLNARKNVVKRKNKIQKRNKINNKKSPR